MSAGSKSPVPNIAKDICCSRWGARAALTMLSMVIIVLCYVRFTSIPSQHNLYEKAVETEAIIPASTIPQGDETVNFELIPCNCSHKSLVDVEPSNPNDPIIDIIISIDTQTLPAFTVLMNSILRHTKSTVFFHILVTDLHPQTVHRYIQCFKLPPHKREIIIFNSTLLYDAFGESFERYKTYGADTRSYFMHTDSMYARLVFHRIFPSLSVALYMDVDIVVQGDIRELWDKSYESIHKYTISGVQRHSKMKDRVYGWYFIDKVRKAFAERYKKKMNAKRETFINGLYMENLDRWRQQEESINKELMFWMDKNSKNHWWTLGSITLTFIVFYDDWIAKVEPEWHVESLGYRNVMSVKEAEKAKLIHFNGKYKPWRVNEEEKVSKYAIFWNRQIPKMCTDSDGQN